MLAGYTAGIPVAPISVAYSLQSHDHAKLKAIARCSDPARLRRRHRAVRAGARGARSRNGRAAGEPHRRQSRSRHVVRPARRDPPQPRGRGASAAIGAGTIAKFLFTSGSTGHPKGVINTHGMLTANQQQVLQTWPFLAEQPLGWSTGCRGTTPSAAITTSTW